MKERESSCLMFCWPLRVPVLHYRIAFCAVPVADAAEIGTGLGLKSRGKVGIKRECHARCTESPRRTSREVARDSLAQSLSKLGTALPGKPCRGAWISH
jgi:hypothetical protein